MKLEDIEDQDNSIPETKVQGRMALDPNQGTNVKEQRRGSSSLLSAAGIGYEQRRKTSFQQQEAGKVFTQGNQVYVEDKDGKVTRMEILEVKEKMGLLRKAVPTLPIGVAVLFCLVNCVLPGIGTFLGALSLFCCGTSRHESRSDGVKYGIIAALVQILTCLLIVGWIYSIYYGVKMIQDSITKAAVNPTRNTSSTTGGGEGGGTTSATSTEPEVTFQVKQTQAWA